MSLRSSRISADRVRVNKMHYNRMELPTGQLVTPQEILAGIALLEIEAVNDVKTLSKLLKFARAISKIKA